MYIHMYAHIHVRVCRRTEGECAFQSCYVFRMVNVNTLKNQEFFVCLQSLDILVISYIPYSCFLKYQSGRVMCCSSSSVMGSDQLTSVIAFQELQAQIGHEPLIPSHTHLLLVSCSVTMAQGQLIFPALCSNLFLAPQS